MQATTDSHGYYSITGSIANARLPNRFAIAENTPDGTLVGVVPASIPNGDPLTYNITSGNTGNIFALDNSGNLTVAVNTLLDYEALARNTQLAVQFQMFVDIVDTLNPALTETNRRVLVAITNVNEPPTLTGFSSSVLEHMQPGTVIGTVTGSDPDFYTLLSYSIVGGNTNAMLAAANFSLTALVTGESINVTKTTGTYNSKDVSTANTVTATLAAGDFTEMVANVAAKYSSSFPCAWLHAA